MKKKTFILLSLIPLLLVSCGGKEKEWFSTSTIHWQMDGDKKINQGSHSFSPWEVETSPTCTIDGKEIQECTICHYKKENVLPMLGHNYGEWISEGNSSYRICSNCNDKQVVIREKSISINNKFNGATIDLCEQVIRDLYDNRYDDDYVATHHMTYRNNISGVSYDNQVYIEPSWSSNKEHEKYILTIAKDNEFKDIFDVYETKGTSIRLDGIFVPGETYFYKIDADDGDYSEVDSFITKDAPIRYINAGGVNNVRDLGGWETTSGKHVKYGLVYRGAGLNDGSVSAMDYKTREVFKKINLRGELDLRNGASTQNALDSSLPHQCVNGGWYTDIISNEEKIAALGQSLRFLADSSNYPCYFHCSFGMDRTGTLSYILLAALGVSEKDIYLEYELSDYSYVANGIYSHCERAVIEKKENDEGYCFNYYTNNISPTETLRTPVYACIQNIKNTYKANTLQESVKRYLIEKVNISETVINRLESNLLY